MPEEELTPKDEELFLKRTVLEKLGYGPEIEKTKSSLRDGIRGMRHISEDDEGRYNEGGQ